MLKIGDDVCHEGHVLLMEKGLGGGSRLQARLYSNTEKFSSNFSNTIAKTLIKNVKGIGNKWVHRYLSISEDKKTLTLSAADDGEKLHKDVKYQIIRDNSLDSPISTTDRRFTFDIMALEMKSQEKRSLTIQAADYNEFTQWKARLGPNMSGNARVFKTGTPGQLGHLTMNLKISDHIIGESQIRSPFYSKILHLCCSAKFAPINCVIKSEISERITTAVVYIEANNGLSTEGIYRLTGVQSKVDDLISIMINEHTDPIDWDAYDLRTMTSAVKGLFRNFKEPLMTFELHERFLGKCFHFLKIRTVIFTTDCVKNQSMSIDSRVDNLRNLVKSLPKANQVLLSHITQHLG